MVLASIALASVSTAYEAKSDLGRTMWVGDSLTHGLRSASWRWPFHKILVDNGISYKPVGIQRGDWSKTNRILGKDPSYGGVAFDNLHTAQSGITAQQVAGFGGDYLDKTSILNWLNPKDTSSYHISAEDTPRTFFLLLGTNDLKIGVEDAAAEALLKKGGYMDIILGEMRKTNSKADIVALTVPVWPPRRHGKDAHKDIMDRLAAYNTRLRKWAAGHGINMVKSDRGIVDVAHAGRFGVGSMYSDKLHPNAQGDMIIAGNVAKALGFAGRTAGQKRRDAASFHYDTASILGKKKRTLTPGATFSYTWPTPPTGGFTVAFALDKVGNGAEGGWDVTHHVSVNIGNGAHSGTLNINEAYIQWGNTILYSLDSSSALKNTTLRIAYIRGNAQHRLASGFYVWLGDQLIGEALPDHDSAPHQTSGVRIANDSAAGITLRGLWLDDSGSWAPVSSGYSAGNPLYPGDTPTE